MGSVRASARPPGGRSLLTQRQRLLLGAVALGMTLWAVWRDTTFLQTMPIDDIVAYQCYAEGFWHGAQASVIAPATKQCSAARYRFWLTPPQQFRSFPREYPPVAIAVFSLPLLIPWLTYRPAYIDTMAILLLIAILWLAWRAPPHVAIALPTYVLLAGWATALARFDLVPSLCVLASLVCLRQSAPRWATAWLALAVLLKLFAVVVFPVLLIAEYRRCGRWRGDLLLLFAGSTGVGLLVSLAVNPQGISAILSYNALRPPQIESLPGSLLWVTGLLGAVRHVVLSYHSLNVVGTWQNVLSSAFTLFLLLALPLTYWRQWKGWDSMERGYVLSLLVILVGSKLLSPQYMLWLLPVVAYAEGIRLRWIVVAYLTVVIYPNAYQLSTNMVSLPSYPLFMWAIVGRNAVLVGITIVYLAGNGDTRTHGWPAVAFWQVAHQRLTASRHRQQRHLALLDPTMAGCMRCARIVDVDA